MRNQINWNVCYAGWTPDEIRTYEEMGGEPVVLLSVDAVNPGDQETDRCFFMHIKHEEGTLETVAYFRPLSLTVGQLQELSEQCPVKIGKRYRLAV